jgi:hypothetical protein
MACAAPLASAVDLRGTFATVCMLANLTNSQIADILGCDTARIDTIRRHYVDSHRIVMAIGERISNTKM